MLNFWKKIEEPCLGFKHKSTGKNIDFHVHLQEKILNYQLSG